MTCDLKEIVYIYYMYNHLINNLRELFIQRRDIIIVKFIFCTCRAFVFKNILNTSNRTMLIQCH